jgi:hypothetical protein
VSGAYDVSAVKSYWIASASFVVGTLNDLNAETPIDNSADGINGFNGTWLCDAVTFPSGDTESVSCHRYQPQVGEGTWTDDYRFSPASSENESAATYNVASYFSSRSDGSKYTSDDGITLLGAADLAAAATVATIFALMF